MAAEGAVAVTAAILAGSGALLGFGLDSVVKALASIIVVWRFTGTRTLSETAEHTATTWAGVAVSAASLVVMPLLGIARQRIGTRLGSAAVRGEGTENLICAYLAAAVLAGLLANTAMAVHEGRETREGHEEGEHEH